MAQYAVTVVTHDRPGLIADVTGALSDLGGNLQCSSMSLLQGNFAWTLVVDIDAPPQDLESRLRGICPHGVTVIELDHEASEAPTPGDHVVVSLHGADRIGIVAAVARVIADAGGNIVELTTHLADGIYLGTAEVDFPTRTDIAALDASLRNTGEALGVHVSAHREDPDLL